MPELRKKLEQTAVLKRNMHTATVKMAKQKMAGGKETLAVNAVAGTMANRVPLESRVKSGARIAVRAKIMSAVNVVRIAIVRMVKLLAK